MTDPSTDGDAIAAILAQPFDLASGQRVKNRIVKSAMSETLAGRDNRVPASAATLYGRWAAGGLGLSITGNVMVDGRAIGEPGNIVVEDDRDLDALSAWATAAQSHGGLIYMQINHPGRQAPLFLNRETVAPSAVALRTPGFGVPRELDEAEILDLIQRYGRTAAVAEKAGFNGVQIHGAHGYLVSQFLSPLTNLRTDQWGDSDENRRRFVIEVYREIRRQTSDGFGVAIKINSADFQTGGISEDDSAGTIVALTNEGLDFVEISGGTYEAPAMMGAKKSTRAREAYFLEFGAQLRERTSTPLVVTGGWRSGSAMAAAVDAGSVDLVGLARGLAVNPDFPAQLTTEGDVRQDLVEHKTGIQAIDRMRMVDLIWYERQLHRMGAGKEPRQNEGAWWTMLAHTMTHGPRAFRRRRG